MLVPICFAISVSTAQSRGTLTFKTSWSVLTERSQSEMRLWHENAVWHRIFMSMVLHLAKFQLVYSNTEAVAAPSYQMQLWSFEGHQGQPRS
jgi:hypothetical protein